MTTYEPGEDGADVTAEPGGEYGVEPLPEETEGRRRKYYVDGGLVEIAAHLVHEFETLTVGSSGS